MKNRNRGKYTFANINLFGRCNLDCYFCLGKDLGSKVGELNHLRDHHQHWKQFPEFLEMCKEEGIKKIYITGQTADSLQYPALFELVHVLQHYQGFKVGLRTNGLLAPKKMDTINLCKLGASYTIHGLDPMTVKMITGSSMMPDWHEIFIQTKRPRAAIVVNRCNVMQIMELLDYCTSLPNLTYLQVRKVSTDTRLHLLDADMQAFETAHVVAAQNLERKDTIYGDAPVYTMNGKDVVFWRTVQTDANSFNYFTDGTISKNYFIVEGYQRETN